MLRPQPFGLDRRCALSRDDRRETLRAIAPSRSAHTASPAPSINRNRALVAALLIALAGCSNTTHVAAVEATATPIPAQPGAAAVVVPASPSPGALHVAQQAPVAIGTGANRVAVRLPGGALPVTAPGPAILSVRTTPAIVHNGDTLVWDVRTTPDVVDVVAHVTLYAFRLTKRAPGLYVLTFTIPPGVPGFFHGTYTLDLQARSASGAQASSKVAVTFQ